MEKTSSEAFRDFKRPPTGREFEPTRHIGVLGIGSSDEEVLRIQSESIGPVLGIDKHSKNYGVRFVTFEHLGDAVTARSLLGDKLAPLLGRLVHVHYVVGFPGKVPKAMQCTSETASVVVRGLTLLEAFVSLEEEAALLRYFVRADADWTGPLKRRVQHFGRAFDYYTRHVDFDAPVQPLPRCLHGVLERMAELGLRPFEPDQLTLNEYEPGQGISPHIDTHSAFEDGLASLSLGSGCVMDLRHPDGVHRKSVFLPRGSLLVMEGAARYQWSHGIASRKTDMVDGVIAKRKTRISLTFRRVRDPSIPCDCAFESSCDRRISVPTADYIKPTSHASSPSLTLKDAGSVCLESIRS